MLLLKKYFAVGGVSDILQSLGFTKSFSRNLAHHSRKNIGEIMRLTKQYDFQKRHLIAAFSVLDNFIHYIVHNDAVSMNIMELCEKQEALLNAIKFQIKETPDWMGLTKCFLSVMYLMNNVEIPSEEEIRETYDPSVIARQLG